MLLNKLLEPSSFGRSAREASASASFVTVPPGWVLPAAVRPRSSSVRDSGRASASAASPAVLFGCFFLAASTLRLLTSGSFGQAGLLATVPVLCGGGRLRLGGTTSGARSRYSMPSPS